MGLDAYRRKRDFGATREPAGEVGRSEAGALSFVIQKHAARRLHYDFRLELDGVLLSWAVPKGPSLDPADKRLAVRTEDHPLEYGRFEGTIPAGEYGGGAVLLWDRGTWTPDGDPHAALAQGSLAFTLSGERLRGGWRLIRTGAASDEAWLLVKRTDDEARPGAGTFAVDTHTGSVESGRDLEQIAADGDRVWTRDGEGLPWPLEPALATAADAPPRGPGWVHEIKLDGYRVLVRLRAGRATFCTRSGLDWTDKLPELVAAVQALPVKDAVFDGEIVALDPAGRSSFSLLQQRIGAGRGIHLYLFDVLGLGGRDLRPLPLRARKDQLRRLLPAEGRVRYVEDLDADGALVLAHLCALGAEGVVSKRADAPYRSGRGRDWIKVKCLGREDFAVGGYIARGGALASVLLGTNDEDGLRYAGRAGSGFTDALRRSVQARLDALRTEDCPFVARPPIAKGDRAVWARPALVAEVSFTERTRDGVLRHPVFRGVREDVAIPRAASTVSNPDKVLYPESGITKAELAAWVEHMTPRLLPELVDRPLTLVRCPNGHDSPPRFFMKHRENVPDAIVAVRVPGDDAPYMAIRGAEGLIALVQAAALEVHPWGARIDRPDLPDRVIVDLDPDEALPFREVVAAAHEVRERLAARDLVSFVRLTGGKGLHVVVPLTRGPGWDEVKRWSKALADEMVRASPSRYVAVSTKARRKGKIYIDYLRNTMGASAIGTWWFRARPGAPVAKALTWDELVPELDPQAYTVRTVRLPAVDPWAGIEDVQQALR